MNASLPPDPRRRSGAPVALIVIAVAVPALALAVLGGVVAGFFFFRRAQERTTPPPSASNVSSGPVLGASAGQGSASPVPDEPIDDSAPSGTPAASLRARPSWAKREGLAVYAKASSQYAPQLSNALEVFLVAQPLSEEVERGVVLCRFQSFNKHDSFAGDDLHARVTFGSTPEVANDGPEDGNLAFVSAPLVTLKKGDRVGFQVFDRDVFGLTPITTTGTSFNAGPLMVMDSGAAIECRGLVGDALRRAVSAKLSAASGELIELERSKLDERKSDWGYPASRILATEKAVTDVAALTGWDDARTRERVERYDTQAKRLVAEREALFDGLLARATSTGRVGSFEVTIGGSGCSGASACVPLSVTNRGAVAHRFGGYPMSTYFATRARGQLWANIGHAANQDGLVQPGATVERHVLAMGALPDEPTVLGLCSDGVCAVLAVR